MAPATAGVTGDAQSQDKGEGPRARGARDDRAIGTLGSDASLCGLPFDERLRMVVDHACQEMEDARVARLPHDAHLRLPQADVADIDYDGRPPGRTPVTELATCHLVATATDVIAEGLAGTGNYAEKRIMSGNGPPPQAIRSRQPRPLA